MNYELAKKLKEAGFPFDRSYTDPEQPRGWIDENEKYADWKVSDDFYYVPTLSELIESCGENFESLIQDVYEGTWNANGVNEVGDDELVFVYGDTPEEAVANLWLELNRK